MISSETLLNGQIGSLSYGSDITMSVDTIKEWKPNLVLVVGTDNDFNLTLFTAGMINNNVPVFRIKDKVSDAFTLRSLKIIVKDILLRGGHVLVLNNNKNDEIVNFLKKHL